MKTILVTGDVGYNNTEQIMKDLEYLFRVKALPEVFEVITTEAPGVEAVIAPVLRDAGISVVKVSELPEVIDIVIVFLNDKEQRSTDIMMHQWQLKRPVYPFKVSY